jgi:hypothetical protein
MKSNVTLKVMVDWLITVRVCVSVFMRALVNCEFVGQLPLGVIVFTVAPNIRLFILVRSEHQTRCTMSTLHEAFI